MSDNYMGEIRLIAGSFVPSGWQACDGTLLSIADNGALYAVLGTQFGGDGVSNFAVPNLNGRVTVGAGYAVTGTNYTVGMSAGAESVTLNTGTIPTHGHGLQGAGVAGDTSVPTNQSVLSSMGPAGSVGSINTYAAAGSATQTALTGNSVGNAGNSQPHPNIQPSLSLIYCIALYGVYPSQN